MENPRVDILVNLFNFKGTQTDLVEFPAPGDNEADLIVSIPDGDDILVKLDGFIGYPPERNPVESAGSRSN